MSEYLTIYFSNLVNLDVGGDPAWDAISCHSRHLTATMIQCRDTHLSQEQTALEEGGWSMCLKMLL